MAGFIRRQTSAGSEVIAIVGNNELGLIVVDRAGQRANPSLQGIATAILTSGQVKRKEIR